MAQGQAKEIGKKKTAKFERCVQHLKDQGKSIGSAHAVCNDSLRGKIQRKKK